MARCRGEKTDRAVAVFVVIPVNENAHPLPGGKKGWLPSHRKAVGSGQKALVYLGRHLYREVLPNRMHHAAWCRSGSRLCKTVQIMARFAITI